ncbi:protein SERAC1 [Plodia interpunctella]|uniref:protein SERAC1 n=1 Tax=Plodia interpunctella TaxID=58824 RepID=UPI0023681E8F|nr:protein SERAC1 [Plodia interpunctella]
MSIPDRIKPFIKILKEALLWGSGGLFVIYQINQTRTSICRIVNDDVLNIEKKGTPEYIYIDDPAYSMEMKLEQDRESRQSVGLARIWKSVKHSLAWRLLWLCKHGNWEQRNIALEQLANFKNNKIWDCWKLAQALDKNTAVLLARTRGADLRYFLPPPIHVRRAALTPQLLSFQFRDMIVAAQNAKPHGCIKHFLSKYFANIQEQAMEADSIPAKPDSISEKELCMLCLDAIHHHILLFHNKDYEQDVSSRTFVDVLLLPKLAELLLRNRNDSDIEMAVLRILTVLSIHSNLLEHFFQNGLIGELSRMLRSHDVRLSSSAAVALANLSGEHTYRPGLFLLHPIYRTTTPTSCDTLLVHGLRGGVFVTWRQRDKKCAEPVGIIEVTVSDNDCDPCEEKPDTHKHFSDPELNEVIQDLVMLDEEALLAEYEVILHDIPTQTRREPDNSYNYTSMKKRVGLINEDEDHCNYTHCWPRDWLPKDCNNLRILGVNYWSTLSEWVERCPMLTADIGERAAALSVALVDAKVGSTPVVWLSHSMGGLIAKQLLVDAAKSEESHLQDIAKNTRAVFFYSTPHKGSSLATMPRAAAAVLWPSNDVKQLQVDSPVLLELHSNFISHADKWNWETISFGETLPTLVTAFKVPILFVDADSADLGRGTFYELPLDHLSICKPATRQSILYTTVLDVIQKITSENVEMVYYNPVIQFLLDFFWSIISNKTREVFESLDDSQSTERLRWFEKILLEAFTEGFTD